MELTGTVKHVFDTKQISASFRKRELVVTTEDKFPQTVLVEFTQDKVSLLDRVKPGEQVKVEFNIRGREWTSPQGQVKYFVSLQGWRIDSLQAAAGGFDDEPPFPSDPPPRDDALDDEIPF
ncbi:MAG: DUF3127 domain-containing protein [Myxococcales bacterium FL481]|nr:MAG: DUF3127 domain-containing protein [Myxococcales bacterium FL481]